MAKKTPAGSAFKFEPQATDYSAVNAYALAQCANLAYDSDKNAAKQTAAWGFPASNYKFFDKGGTQGFAIANDDTAIFAFRGTGNEKEDLLADANIEFTNGPFGTGSRIHQGFARALNEVAKFVERMMRKYKRSGDRSVWFTGHSLGAALATLAAASMLDAKGKVTGMYTFGSPRVGNKKFVTSLNAKLKNHYRMVYGKDIVSRVAPRALKYAHAGQLTTIATNGNISHKGFTEASFLKNVFHTLVALQSVDFSSVEDHKLKNGYLPMLKKRATS
jgi:triacylglycerol lipase